MHKTITLPKKAKNLRGLTSGGLIVEVPVGQNKGGNILWKCKCVCGNTTVITQSRFGKTQGCRKCAGKRISESKKVPIKVRFWKYVQKTPNCWLWTGAKDKDGYGRISNKSEGRKADRANRICWKLTYGTIATGKRVLHTCDNPSCVRPDHLFLGENKDNSADMVAKGRQARGARQWKSKLTEAAVRDIRSSSERNEVLAVKYKVSAGTIWHVRAGITWKHVGD